ncbi:hypothetical protein QUF90_09190 [Desulfococcaceae bacterium HSG9]|nr:hypothetical protein [Desulfococcaceae bacterium HSG9]
MKISAIRTDPKDSNSVIARIREHDKPLTDALAGLVKTYYFDIISRWKMPEDTTWSAKIAALDFCAPELSIY